MKNRKKIILALSLLIIYFCAPLTAMAAATDTSGTAPNSTSPTTTPSSSSTSDTTTKNAIQCGINSAANGDCNTTPSGSLNTTIKDIVNLLSALVGVVAVIMIIIAGLRFVTSAGSPEAAKSARGTILYAIIGLVVVALAQLIVHFVLDKVS